MELSKLEIQKQLIQLKDARDRAHRALENMKNCAFFRESQVGNIAHRTRLLSMLTDVITVIEDELASRES